MLSQKTFNKLTALGLNQEHFIGVTGLLFEAVEETTNKLMASFSKQFVDVVEVTENKILEVVETTENKIFARMAAQVQEVEEKKRQKREELAARKAAKALENASKGEGVAAAPESRFREENTFNAAGTAATGETGEGETGGVDGKNSPHKREGESQQDEAGKNCLAESIPAAKINLIPMKAKYADLREAVCILDDLYVEQAHKRGYNDMVADPEWQERNAFITRCEEKAKSAAYEETARELRAEVTDETGRFLTGWDEKRFRYELNDRLETVEYDAGWLGRLEWERSQGREIEIAS